MVMEWLQEKMGGTPIKSDDITQKPMTEEQKAKKLEQIKKDEPSAWNPLNWGGDALLQNLGDGVGLGSEAVAGKSLFSDEMKGVLGTLSSPTVKDDGAKKPAPAAKGK